MNILEDIADAIVRMSPAEVERLCEQALAAYSPKAIIAEALSRGIEALGERFACQEAYIPEVMAGCDCYYAGMRVLRPRMASRAGLVPLGTIAIGAVRGDIHTVGKDVAVPVFEAAGFHVVDLGVGVDESRFVAAIRQYHVDILGLGAYMTITMPQIRATVRHLEAAGLRGQVKVICGGPTMDSAAAKALGADDGTNNAWKAVEIMRQWMTPPHGQSIAA